MNMFSKDGCSGSAVAGRMISFIHIGVDFIR